ncbi:MAG TPA: PDZ domain-containing protein [Firmicutes bacterium]|nr:PDZ domain-containing protein [Bacillota bacterium]
MEDGFTPADNGFTPIDNDIAADGQSDSNPLAPTAGGQKKTTRRSFWRERAPVVAVIALLVAGMLMGGTATWAYFYASRGASPVPIAHPLNVSSIPEGIPAGTVTAVYDQVAPTVVKIQVSTVTQGFFGPQTEEGTGSGVVVDPQGYVLTNYHVVKGAQSVKVTLSDGTTVEGRVTGTDPGNDLAVVKINPSGHNLRVAVLGNSDLVQVGELAIAIGNPFGLDRTVTAGIISGKDRQMTAVTGRTIRGLLQTDAAINPGNSGGPLFNARGEVIGINTAIESPVKGSVGIGFAIPINTARRILPSLITGKQVEHPWLGIGGTALTPELAQRLQLSVQTGVLVSEVVAGSPADKAGLRPLSVTQSGRTLPGDIITAVDGKPVKSVEDIAQYLEGKRAGDEITVTVLRDGTSVQLKATLAPWPEDLLDRQSASPSLPGLP